jgi:hypothetical protein
VQKQQQKDQQAALPRDEKAPGLGKHVHESRPSTPTKLTEFRHSPARIVSESTN